MVTVQVHATIATTPSEFLGLVMDIERYAEVDDKIRPVLWSRRDGNRVEFACRPKLAGLRQPTVVQFLELTPDRRIDIGLLPKPQRPWHLRGGAWPTRSRRAHHVRGGDGAPPALPPSGGRRGQPGAQ